jgi:hypothetical protein
MRRELYRSAPNGDRWTLVREPASERVFIEHEPNASVLRRSNDTY